MEKEKFKVLDSVKKLLKYVDTNLVNFRKSDIELKERVRYSCYDMLELGYEANMLPDNKEYKVKLIYKMLAKAKMIDYLMSLAHEKELITAKKTVTIGRMVDEITRLTMGWLKVVSPESIKLAVLESQNGGMKLGERTPEMVDQEQKEAHETRLRNEAKIEALKLEKERDKARAELAKLQTQQAKAQSRQIIKENREARKAQAAKPSGESDPQ